MNMTRIAAADIPEARHVEVLTAAETGQIIGYRMQGARPGPTVLVTAHAPDAGLIFDRLLGLPTLPWLRGTLCLIEAEALEEAGPSGADDLALYGPVDEVLFLPCAANLPDRTQSVRDGYWAILRLCGRLGMIDGRGVFREQ